ncbi:integral membrane protein [Neofusicoccum parvum]|nr:integral membrane protein [Neofusicoccum parvum]
MSLGTFSGVQTLTDSQILSIAMTGVVGGEVYVASKMVGHRWNEEANDVSIIAKLVLCSNLLYQVLTNATKSSFLLQYLRLFQQRWIQWACKVSLAVVFGAALYGFFGGIFMCNPATKYWNPSVPGHCSDAQKYWFASALLGILMDFVVWLLPMPLIKGLRLPLRQKLSLMAVFALGGFVCVVSILRILLVHMYAANDNMEGAGIAAITWSTVEANVGIICASLMVMKPLVAKVFPRLLDSTGPSRRNLRLPTITEDTMGPICWNRNWEWGSTNGAMCSASRPSSWMHAPQDSHAILVTKKSVVEANWTGRDSISGNTLRKPSRAYGRDSVV